jgi:hypothetical protein
VGGYRYRRFDTNSLVDRTQVTEDNTYSSPLTPNIPLRGDYAVPTLFNGNFDAITRQLGGTTTVPGWSLYNGGGSSNDGLQSQLARNVGGNSTYSFRLGGGGSNTLTHPT